ncbi:CAP domain-containing protein, partial [Pseudonocardia bannensis]
PTPPARPTPPAPVSTPTRPVPPAAANGGLSAQVVILTNEQRARAGCRALRVDDRITAAAQKHSADMATHEYFSHTGRNGSSFGDRVRAEGYPSPGAENIAQGQPTASRVVEAWMNSPGHRANILDCSLITIGVGHDARGDYWTQDFGR